MNGIIDSISNLLMPLCSVWIVNKFVNNSFEKKESKKIFTRIIWGLFILIQIVMETEKGNVSIQKGMQEKLNYKHIYQNTKAAVNLLADVLVFKKQLN